MWLLADIHGYGNGGEEVLLSASDGVPSADTVSPSAAC